MEIVFVVSFIGLIISILMGMVRLVMGPTIMDRILAFDFISICSVGMMVLLSLKWQTLMFIELILIFSLLGFLGTVTFVYFLQSSYASHQRTGEGSEEERTKFSRGEKII